ncbi:MAG: mercuric reductase [Candidatus Omnitrophica bacterium]|nr:mercuric reductase [Candidatus Omnitrophota bacterium]
MDKFDLVIIGGGVAGLVTASGASQFGARVALVEKETLGGDCLHWGCVPTKRLVESAKVAFLARHAKEFGVETQGVRINFREVMAGMKRIQEKIGRNDDPERFRKMGVQLFFGEGKFLDPHTFEVKGTRLSGRKFLIATGSRPILLPILGLKESGALTNMTALKLEELPASLIILGAGPIGLEFAQVFSRLGAKVTVIEKMPQILPREDTEIADRLQKILTEEGIEIITRAEVKKIEKNDRGQKIVTAEIEGEGTKIFDAQELLVSIGRAPNVEGLNLEASGVAYEKKGIKVDESMRTSQKHIFAAGDVTGQYLFTHVGEYQAGLVVSNALFPFMSRKADYRVVPWITFTNPELGRVGLTEAEAKKTYGEKNIQVFRFFFKDVDRAVIEGEGSGLVKLICDKKNQILGAHLLGPGAGEYLHEFVLAMKARLPITQISQTIHVYPTLAQVVKRTADQYYRQKLFTGWFPKFAKRLIRFS